MKKIYLLLSVLFMSFSSYGFEKLSSDQGVNQVQQTSENRDGNITNNEINITSNASVHEEVFSEENTKGLNFIENPDNTIDVVSLRRNNYIDSELMNMINYHNENINSENYKNVDTIIVDDTIVMQPRILNDISLAARYTKVCIWWWWGKCRKYFNLLTTYSIITNTQNGVNFLNIIIGMYVAYSAFDYFSNSWLKVASQNDKEALIGGLKMISVPLYDIFSSIPVTIINKMVLTYIVLKYALTSTMSTIQFLLAIAIPPFWHLIDIITKNRRYSLNYGIPFIYRGYNFI